MEYRVVIPAAGQGKRMKAGKNKQFILLEEQPVIVHTLNVFQNDPNCIGIILVINEKEKKEFRELVDANKLSKVSHILNGGKERQDSVYKGLKVLPGEEDGVVLIHDGARPFVTSDMITRVAKKAAAKGAAVLAVPLKDTIKSGNDEVVLKTLNRSSLWAVQTPQAFRSSIIIKAYEHAERCGIAATDDASLVEELGYEVSIVLGEEYNIKLTTPYDLLMAEVILKWKENKG